MDIKTMHLIFSYMCMKLEKTTFKDLIHFNYKAIMAPPYGLDPWPRGEEFLNFCWGITVHHNGMLCFSAECPVVENTIFINLHYFLPNIYSLEGDGSWISQLMFHFKFEQDNTSGFREESRWQTKNGSQ